MGASFPAVVRLLAPQRDEEARTLGGVYFVNTVGAVAGALAGEFLILPRLGFDGLLAAVVIVYLASAALFWWLGPPTVRRRAALPLGILAAGALLLTPPLQAFVPPWNAVYYSGVRQGTYERYQALNAAHRVVFQDQGFYGQVTVSRTREDLYLKHNGKTDASTNRSDSFAQYLVGHIPLLLHPRPERVVNIGLGGGITLGAITAHAAAREIVQVELDPLVAQAARAWFAGPNRRALDDPRVRLVVDDDLDQLPVVGVEADLPIVVAVGLLGGCVYVGVVRTARRSTILASGWWSTTGGASSSAGRTPSTSSSVSHQTFGCPSSRACSPPSSIARHGPVCGPGASSASGCRSTS